MTTTTARTTTTPADAGPGEDSDGVAERLVGILDDGAVAILLALGHDTGLLEALASLPPATSQQVADAAGLDERYVREWLGGVACAELVRYDPGGRTYALRPELSSLVTGAGPGNLARTMRFIGLMGQVSPMLVECFRHGGGLTYEDYPGFHEVMAEESAAVNDAVLLDGIVPLTGLAGRLEDGIDVVDIGCGAGHAVNILGRAFPRSRFTGFDISAEALATARDEAARWGLANVDFREHDVAALPVAAYDLVTAFDAIHDQARPAAVLAAVRGALREDGAFLMVDFHASSRLEDNIPLPWGSFLYAISTLHCVPVSRGRGGEGLGTAWGVQLAERMLHDAGFGDVALHEIEDDPLNAYVVARP